MPRDSANSVFDSARSGFSGPVPSYAEFIDFGRDAIAAAMSAGAVAGAGLEAIGHEVSQSAQAAFQSAGEAFRGLLGARTFEDVVSLQSDYAKRSFVGLVERSTKLSELGCAVFAASVNAWAERAKR